jgi:hypothetical protein
MKPKFLKIIKKYKLTLIKYVSYLSDMNCRVVEITLSDRLNEKEFDCGYWYEQKNDILITFEKEINSWLILNKKINEI